MSGDPRKEPGQLTVGQGLALDKCGRELVEIGTSLRFKDVIFLNKEGKRVDLDDLLKRLGIPAGFSWNDPPQGLIDALKETCWVLSVHYAERDKAHVRIEDRCQCGHDEWDHVCETVHYSVRPIDCGECCNGFPCELECACGTGKCCEEPNEGNVGNDPVPAARQWHQRGGCQCLCHHLTKLKLGADCDTLCEIEEPCGNVRVDLNNGVPLACVKLTTDNCGLAFYTIEDACGPRRLIKRNDLLFDLIRGCDLTYIKNYGWKGWHRSLQTIPFSDFADAFGEEGEPGKYITRDFWVEFSRPVRSETVRSDCFAMTIITVEEDDWWWVTSRVPIVGVKKDDTPLIDRARIIVGGTWLEGTIRGGSSRLQKWPTRVEIEVRGDFIVDCNGQTIDANAHGLSKGPTGNGTPGGTFLSTFRVAPQESPAYKTTNRTEGVS
jgi:hypothetical protein